MDKKARCIQLGFSLEALLGEYVEAIRRMAIERGTPHETLEDLAREVQRFCARSSCLLECLEEDIRVQMPGAGMGDDHGK